MRRSIVQLAAVLALCGAPVACTLPTESAAPTESAIGGQSAAPADVVGTWNGSTTIQCFGQVSDQMIFEANGHFSRLTSFTEANCIPASYLVKTTGDYAADASLGVIRLTNIDTEPKVQCLPFGPCQSVATVTSDTLSYTMPDSNSLTLSCGAGCILTYTRAP